MKSSLNNNIINNYIQKDFIPHLYRAIDNKITQNNVESNMPQLISQKMVIKLLDSSVKNSNLSNSKNKKIIQLQQRPHQKVELKVQFKKISHQSKFITNPQQNQSALINHYNTVQPQKRNKSQLIKLPDREPQQDIYDIQIRQLMAIKKRMRNFTKDIQIRGQQHAKASHRQRSFKKHALNESTNHTYDYETNLIPVNQSKLQNILEDSYQKSLLEIIKTNLDMEIQQQKLQSQLKKQEEIVQQKNTKIDKKKIQVIQYPDSQQNIDKYKKYRPFKFQLSNINSLSKQVDKDISSGVKMVTYQQKIIQQLVSTKNKQFSLLSKEIIKQKKKDKLETQGSQSIIYLLQKKWDKEHGSQRKSNLSRNASQLQQYYSIQYQNDNKQVKYKPLSSKKSIQGQDDYMGIKLPQINIFTKKSNANKQRILTEQKMIKKLSDVQIRLSNKTELSNPEKEKDQSQILSTHQMKKYTESSLSEGQNKSSRNSKTKKQYVKDYFKNYVQQFRHKLSPKDDINSLYI